MKKNNKAKNKRNNKNKYLKNTVIATSATLVASIPVNADADEFNVGYILNTNASASTENYKYGAVTTTLNTSNTVGDLKTEILKEMNILSGLENYSIYVVNISDSSVELNKQGDSDLLDSISPSSRIVIAKSSITDATVNNSQDQNFSDNKITTGTKLSPGSKSDSNKLTIVGSFV